MPKIFVSYRRLDSEERAHRIADWLVNKYGLENVFIDVDRIGGGADFIKTIETSLTQSDVLLIIIGQGWIEELQRRIKQPEVDFVRLEVRTGLEQIPLVIPILINENIDIDKNQLPDDIRPMMRRQFRTVRGGRDFHRDIELIQQDINKQYPNAQPTNFRIPKRISYIFVVATLAIISLVILSNLGNNQSSKNSTGELKTATLKASENINKNPHNTSTPIIPSNSISTTQPPRTQEIESSPTVNNTPNVEIIALTVLAQQTAQIANETIKETQIPNITASINAKIAQWTNETATQISQNSTNMAYHWTPTSTFTAIPTPSFTSSPTQTPTSSFTSTPLPTRTPSPTSSPTSIPTSTIFEQSVITAFDGFGGSMLSSLWGRYGQPNLQFLDQKMIWNGIDDGLSSGIQIGGIRVGESISIVFKYADMETPAIFNLTLQQTACCYENWKEFGFYHSPDQSSIGWQILPDKVIFKTVTLNPDEWYRYSVQASSANQFSINIINLDTDETVMNEAVNMDQDWTSNPYWVFDMKVQGGILIIDSVEMAQNLKPTNNPYITPFTVHIAGDFLDEIGCPTDYIPDCPQSELFYNNASGFWENTIEIPAGTYIYKATINGSWDENYGICGLGHGGNMRLYLAQTSEVTFTYNPLTHKTTDNINIMDCQKVVYQN